MLVRDLIYLLQTRAELDQEVFLACHKGLQENLTQLTGDFDVVHQEYNHGFKDTICIINLENDWVKMLGDFRRLGQD